MLMNVHSFFGRNTKRRFLVYSLLADIAPAGSRFVSSQNYDIQQVNQSVTVVLASLALSPTHSLTYLTTCFKKTGCSLRESQAASKVTRFVFAADSQRSFQRGPRSHRGNCLCIEIRGKKNPDSVQATTFNLSVQSVVWSVSLVNDSITSTRRRAAHSHPPRCIH